MNLYAGPRLIGRRDTTWRVIKANGLAMLFFFAYFYLTHNQFHPRSLFVIALFVNVIYCVAFRGLIERLLRWMRLRYGADACPTILIGSGTDADSMAEYIAELRPQGIAIAARVETDPAEPPDALADRIREATVRHQAYMLICADRRFDVNRTMRILELAESLGVEVKILSEHLEVLVYRAHMPVDIFLGAPLVHFSASSASRGYQPAKRALALAMAGGALVVLSPLLLLIALLIRLTSPGPVLFVQERMGINRKPFRMYKFRTMLANAEELQAGLEARNESGPGLFKVRNDPRITPFGRFLRRFSLDEIPQLFNVIGGDMTIVGPRPLPRRDFENYYEEWHYSRHGGLPGLTCLWQVSGRSDIDFHKMCILDVYYLRNASIMLDLKIILRTVGVVLFAKGAY